MKSRIVLMVSLLLNGVLVLLLARRSEPPSSNSADEHRMVRATNALAPTDRMSLKPVTVAGFTVPTMFDWRTVESDDYKRYIANLRAIGCPEQTIRDIIVADVSKLFDSRRREINTGSKKFEFWKTGNPFASMMDADKLEKQQKLTQERRALLKELLGVEPDEKFDLFAGMNPYESMLDFLPVEKQSMVMQMFQDMQIKLMKKRKDGQSGADDVIEAQQAEKELEAGLANILSPQELEDYQLRMSRTAENMRMLLASFDPSEQEFRDIFKVRNKYDNELSFMGVRPRNSAEREKMDAAKKEMDAQLKSILGDTRYADYERAQDWAYTEIARVAERQRLPKESAVKVYEIRKAAESEARNLRNNGSLSTEQRTAMLQGIRVETESSIKEVFGEKGWQSYQSDAYWLQSISPNTKTASR